MIKTVKKLVAENNEKRKMLTEANREYYENFLTYVRSSLFKDERATEEVLLEMVDHLVLAQQEGKTAEEVFGKNPKELADDVVENLPPEPFKYLFTFGVEIIATLLACYTVVIGIMDIIMKQNKTVYLGNMLLIVASLLITITLLIYAIFKMLKKESFAKTKSKAIYIVFVVIFVGGSLVTGLVATMLPNFGRAFELGQYGMFGIGSVLALVTFIMKKIREQR